MNKMYYAQESGWNVVFEGILYIQLQKISESKRAKGASSIILLLVVGVVSICFYELLYIIHFCTMAALV